MRGRSAAAALLAAALLGPGSAGPSGPPDGAVQVGSVDSFAAGPSLDERLAEIRRRIQAAVVYPPLARRRGLEGTARIGFEIGARGHAAAIAVLESSGHPSLDRAATRAVAEAGALPRVYGRLEVPVRFQLARRR